MIKVLLLLFAVAADAIVCTENACDVVRCAAANCTPPAVLKPKGGYCGCCDLCVTYLDEGEECPIPLSGPSPLTVQCREGLECLPVEAQSCPNH